MNQAEWTLVKARIEALEARVAELEKPKPYNYAVDIDGRTGKPWTGTLELPGKHRA